MTNEVRRGSYAAHAEEFPETHGATVERAVMFRASCTCGWRGISHAEKSVAEFDRQEHVVNCEGI